MKNFIKNVNLVLENKLMSGSISIFENKIEKFLQIMIIYLKLLLMKL